MPSSKSEILNHMKLIELLNLIDKKSNYEINDFMKSLSYLNKYSLNQIKT